MSFTVQSSVEVLDLKYQFDDYLNRQIWLSVRSIPWMTKLNAAGHIKWPCTSVLDSFPSISLNAQITLTGGLGLHTEHGCYSQYNTKKCLSSLNGSTATIMYGCSMWKVLLYSSMGNFCWLATQQWASGHSPQKQTGRAATVHIQIHPTKKCNGKQSLLLEIAWLLCTLHSLRIQMSAVVLCLMCQIQVVILSAVYSAHASVYKWEKLSAAITTVLIAYISDKVQKYIDLHMCLSLSHVIFCFPVKPHQL